MGVKKRVAMATLGIVAISSLKGKYEVAKSFTSKIPKPLRKIAISREPKI